MRDYYTVRRVSSAAFVSLLLVLGACDAGNPDSSDADRAAAKENVDAMSREHANDTTDPSPAALEQPQRPVHAETLPYAEVNEELAYGHFAAPSDMVEPLPAVILIHEWWGLNDNIRAVANRLAAEGYMVLAVDLYSGQLATQASEARNLMLEVVESPAVAEENLRQAIDFVSEFASAPKVGVVGWCFGGGWSLNTAMLFPEDIDASVIYYGQVTNDEDKLRAIESPVLGLFAADDRGIRVESVHEFDDAMRRLRKDYSIEIYEDVGHAFANPTGNNYNAEAAEDAWQRTLAFFAEHLGGHQSE
ncbi:MAG: dienelactone hydrolase family protein [Woeseiaceae bacterium]